jgi:hypothetical protein
MPRITPPRALLALAVAAAAIMLIATSASSSDRRHASGRNHVLHVHRDVGHDIWVDVDGTQTPPVTEADSIGDEDVFNGKFFKGGKQVGRDGGVCVLVEQPSIYHCVATNWFEEGQLAVQWLGDFSVDAVGHFAIVGGTGAYRGATGEVTVDFQPDGADVTFRFRTP